MNNECSVFFLKSLKIPNKKRIELIPTTLLSKLFFLNPSLTWTECSLKSNDYQLLIMYICKQNRHGTNHKYQCWYRTILGRFSNLFLLVIHFHSYLGFLEILLLCQAPYHVWSILLWIYCSEQTSSWCLSTTYEWPVVVVTECSMSLTGSSRWIRMPRDKIRGSLSLSWSMRWRCRIRRSTDRSRTRLAPGYRYSRTTRTPSSLSSRSVCMTFTTFYRNCDGAKGRESAFFLNNFYFLPTYISWDNKGQYLNFNLKTHC